VIRRLAENLRRRTGETVSLKRARELAAVHGLLVAHELRRTWILYRRDGLGHPVIYHSLIELMLDLVPPTLDS